MRRHSSKTTVRSLSFLRWLAPHLVEPAGASWNSEMVLCVRFQNRVGRSAETAPVTVTKMSAAAVNRAFCMALPPRLYEKVSGPSARTEEPRMAGGERLVAAGKVYAYK